MLSADPNPKFVDLASYNEVRTQEAWDRYLAAREVAEHSVAIEDGIAAGQAWRDWLDLFQSSEQRDAARECDRVMQLRRRTATPSSTSTPCA